MSYEDDDDLLAALGRAVGPDPDARPSAAERDALRAVVLRAAADAPLADVTTDGPVADVVPITSARRLRNRLLVGGAAVVIGLSGATAVAAAVNDGALPSPVRAVVHAVGLPVDSIELAQAKDALKRLRTATDAEVADALARAERELADLTPAERASLGDDADRTLAEARVRLARVQAPVTTPSTTPPSTVPSTPPSASTPSVTSSSPTSTPTSVDDRGGDDRGGDDRGGSDDSTATSDDRGRGSDDSTATSDDRGGGSDDSSPDSTTAGGTTATTDDSGSGKNRGGDSTAATSSSESTTATTDDSGSGKNRGGGSDG